MAASRILMNDFHRTSYVTRKTEREMADIRRRIEDDRGTKADKAFARRVQDALCGMKDCECGDFYGQR